MKYKEMLKMVARQENTTPEKVDKEIRKAIKSADININPEAFIKMCAMKIKTIYRNKYYI